MNSQASKPGCFGEIDTVFPLGPDGLRITPEACLQCPEKTQCLRAAMDSGTGWRVREEMIERAYRGGVMGFFQRWSRKKAIHRQRNQEGK